MDGSPAGTLRARVRAEMLEEIKAVARRHLASDGTSLSLRAVARDLGMVSSGIYRYYPRRDELLTALIIDAYNAIGAAAESAEAAVARDDLRGRLIAIGRATRAWATANPAEYALVYGTPVPGYVAPQDTIAAAARIPLLIGSIVADGLAAGVITAGVEPERDEPPMPEPTRAELAAISGIPGLDGGPPVVVARAMALWVTVFGLISFELFGHLVGSIFDYESFFGYQVEVFASRLLS